MRVFRSLSGRLSFRHRRSLRSEEGNPVELTAEERTQLLAHVQESLTTVETAEADLVGEILELRSVLSLLTGVASRLEQAGLTLEALAARERDDLLTTQLIELEDRLDVIRSTKDRLRTAEERLEVSLESTPYGPTAPPSINESLNERSDVRNTGEKRRAVFGSLK